MPKKDPSNAELLEFIQENVATKEDLKPLETKVDRLHNRVSKIEQNMATKDDLRAAEDRLQTSLDELSTNVKELKTEKAANTAAHKRFDHRDQVFSGKIGVDLRKVDAEF